MRIFEHFIILTFFVFIRVLSIGRVSNAEDLESIKLPPCAACKAFVNSFKNGFEQTKNGNFEGGDSAYEEKRLGSYATSEVRLTDIQENLCKDVKRGQQQCYSLSEELESFVEKWWYHESKNYPDIYEYLCIEIQKTCCPEHHYGPKCTPCLGYPDQVCNNNGRCKGAGTRYGSGECHCHSGYNGTLCTECTVGYYQSYKDEKKILCSKCHVACKSSCKKSGLKDCDDCADGWQMTDEGCQDINECLKSKKTCPGNQFCVNNDGSFTCLDCDKACNRCTGDGPDMCVRCAEGYKMQNKLCISVEHDARKTQENLARYTTYLGLCIATCIILQKNVYLASVIGLLVGIYISLAEYMIANSNIQGSTANMDTLEPGT